MAAEPAPEGRDDNQVFGLLAGFRAAALRGQQAGFLAFALAAPACAGLALCGEIPVWAALSAPAALLAAAVAHALTWRRVVERRFWRGARRLRPGEPVRLPLEPEAPREETPR